MFMTGMDETVGQFSALGMPQPQLSGYIAGSTADYEEIGRVEGLLDRVAIYPGRLLHSGVIRPPATPEAPLPPRLTANLFVQGWKR